MKIKKRLCCSAITSPSVNTSAGITASVIGFFVLLSGYSAVVSAEVLETPAMQSALAPQSLLVDLDKAGNRIVAVGERGHIIYSDDQGQSWSQASVPVATLLTAVDFVDDRHGWAVGHGAVVLYSEDGGKSWQKQMDGTSANQMVVEQAEQRVALAEQALASATPDVVEDLEYALEDAQFALEDAIADAEVGPSNPLLDVWFKDQTTGFVIGAYGFFFKTIDGGKTWVNWGNKVENTDRFHLNGMTQISDGTLFIAGEAGYVFRSTDSGDSWETLESPYEGSLFGVSGNGLAGQVLVFGLRGNVFFSDDMGSTWSSIDSGAQQSLMSSAIGSGGKLMLVGNSGVMLLSADHGNSFKLKAREDRLAILAAGFLADEKLLLVGENGANIVSDLKF